MYQNWIINYASTIYKKWYKINLFKKLQRNKMCRSYFMKIIKDKLCNKGASNFDWKQSLAHYIEGKQEFQEIHWMLKNVYLKRPKVGQNYLIIHFDNSRPPIKYNWNHQNCLTKENMNAYKLFDFRHNIKYRDFCD